MDRPHGQNLPRPNIAAAAAADLAARRTTHYRNINRATPPGPPQPESNKNPPLPKVPSDDPKNPLHSHTNPKKS
jgi:hypothetical protein